MLDFHMHTQSSNSTEKHPYADDQPVLPLDDGLHRLDDADTTFLKKLTGIYNNEEFKAHLLSIQTEAYEVTHFCCLFNPYLNDVQGVPISVHTSPLVGQV